MMIAPLIDPVLTHLTVSMKIAAASYDYFTTCDGEVGLSGGQGTRTLNPLRGT